MPEEKYNIQNRYKVGVVVLSSNAHKMKKWGGGGFLLRPLTALLYFPLLDTLALSLGGLSQLEPPPDTH